MKKKLGSYQNHQQKNKENLIVILLHLYYGGLQFLFMSESLPESLSFHWSMMSWELLGKLNLFHVSSCLFIFVLGYWEPFDIFIRYSFGYWYFLEFYLYFTQVVLQFFYGFLSTWNGSFSESLLPEFDGSSWMLCKLGTNPGTWRFRSCLGNTSW